MSVICTQPLTVGLYSKMELSAHALIGRASGEMQIVFVLLLIREPGKVYCCISAVDSVCKESRPVWYFMFIGGSSASDVVARLTVLRIGFCLTGPISLC